MSHPHQCLFGHILLDSADFKHNSARANPRYPEFGLTLAFSHSSLQRLAAYRLVREYPQVYFAFPVQKVSRRHSPGFNMSRAYPTGLQSLQAILTKRHKISPGRIAPHFAALALSVFNSFRHHCHCFIPLTINQRTTASCSLPFHYAPSVSSGLLFSG
jgi:hypothetical protein